MAVAQAKLDALAARLAGLSFDPASAVRAARAEAVSRLSAMGLPSRRDEYWRYTDPSSLVAPVAASAAVYDDAADAALFSALDSVKLVFVDGVFDAAQSSDLTLEGVSIERLADAKTDIHWAQDLYGQLEARGQTPVERPLAALNSAFATDGALIRVTQKAMKPVLIVYQNKSEASDAMLHHCIKLEAGAEITVLEAGALAARGNSVMEVDVADGARFHHIRAQGRDHNRRSLTHVFARIGKNAGFKSFTMTANGVLTRNEAVLELLGNDSTAHVAGTALGEGDFHHDDTVFITHAAERCESRQVFKKVLKNGAIGVFQGKILVKQGAQKTDGYQISQALLLEGEGQFLAKPELEIYADDVKCSHGSTSGAIDETALFYLRSRGVPLRAAQSLLVLAFLAEAIGEIEDEAIAEEIRDRLEIWLEQSGR